jgi:hypothetical protein
MEVEMVMTCSRKGPQTPIHTGIGPATFGVTGNKVAKSTGFLAALSQFFISGVKSTGAE